MTETDTHIGFENVTALILAGGLGTRLSTVVNDRSKVMAEISGRPFLTYLLAQLERLGVLDAVVCTGHKADELETAVGDSFGDVSIRYSREREPLGTAGAMALAAPLIESEYVIVLNGDSFFTGDWSACLDAAWRHEGYGAIALVRLEDCAEYGLVQTDVEGNILEFIEKRGVREPGWINAGVYALTKAAIDSIPSGRAVSLEREVFPEWIESGLIGCRIEGDLLDIGTPERLAGAEAFLSLHRVKS